MQFFPLFAPPIVASRGDYGLINELSERVIS